MFILITKITIIHEDDPANANKNPRYHILLFMFYCLIVPTEQFSFKKFMIVMSIVTARNLNPKSLNKYPKVCNNKLMMTLRENIMPSNWLYDKT